jgi:hypothetical protein
MNDATVQKAGKEWFGVESQPVAFGVKVARPIVLARVLALKLLPTAAFPKLRDFYYWYLRRRIRNPELVGPLAKRLAYTVQGGPFSGMVYPEEMVRADIDSPFFPKLLGCYEMECNSAVEEICSSQYDQLINIGSSEGYYAVGLAMRMPRVKVVAFESDAESRRLCAALARLNGVDARIDIRGVCDPDSLLKALREPQPVSYGSTVGESGAPGRSLRSVVICDCEGGEMDLLRPDVIPSLTRTDLLVELHDFVNPEISRTIVDRFAPTHQIQILNNTDRDPESHTVLKGLSGEDKAFLISEHRIGRMQWMFAKVKGE